MMTPLPIDEHLSRVQEVLRGGNGMVLVAPPGAGKTTRVPGAVLEVLGREAPHVVMLQPRRVAARASAQRIAEERGWELGREVGYHIRFEKRYGAGTRIRVFTEAILNRMLLEDPGLEGVGCVILDEFHERNLHTDLAIAFLKEVQETLRPDLKIVVMSATLEAGPVAEFLGGVPVVVTEGRSFPVEVSYRASPRDVYLETHVARAVEEVVFGGTERRSDGATKGGVEGSEGDVLVFLPGVGEIERVRRALGGLEREGCVVLPLHGSLTSEEQQRALRADPQRRKKIILATNIAETSLTIDGVRTVVDSGLARVASFDADRGMDRLDLERISKASATQRAGRAGRQGPGRAVRLWSVAEQNHLADFSVPEVQRVDLAPTLLAVHAWGAREVRGFGWFEKPGEEMVAAGEELLTMLGALEGGKLTEVGREMLGFPAHPRVARLLIAARGTGLEGEAVRLGAVLGDDSRGDGRGDVLSMVERFPAHLEWVREQLERGMGGLRINAPGRSGEERKGVMPSMPSGAPAPQGMAPGRFGSGVEALADLLVLAYPDRVARRRGNDGYAGTLVDGTGVRLAPEAMTPAIAGSALFLALDAHHDPRNKKAEAVVRSAVAIEEGTLRRLFPGGVVTETALEFDEGKGKVVAVTRRRFRGLVLQEDPFGKVEAERAGEVLAEALKGRAKELFARDEGAAKLLARIAFVREHVGEKEWPGVDEGALQGYLVEACRGKKSVAELTEGRALEEAVRGALVYPMDRELERLAPEGLEVPSGSRIKLEYGEGAPVLAVRLQELFGWMETPRVAGGRVAVLLHLLSPGYKPMQITQDLRSFWGSAYFEVRKDLRVRYPKHKWPEDPLTATPEAKGRRRG